MSAIIHCHPEQLPALIISVQAGFARSLGKPVPVPVPRHAGGADSAIRPT